MSVALKTFGTLVGSSVVIESKVAVNGKLLIDFLQASIVKAHGCVYRGIDG